MTRALFPALLAIAACNACDHSVVITQPPYVNYDGAADDSDRACAVLKAAGCPVGADPDCAMALRTDQAQGPASMVDLSCIVDAGPNPSALAKCGVTCR